ncbi:uncharacterized protein [Nicotiana sylvestris]|uniref:uncharacterized protein n=1 Tax=Nicotiana sylvestris TaxID=4096 RepID=UPI00388C35A0
MAESEVNSLDYNHPLFLQASDAPGLVLIILKLTGPKKYVLWSRAIKLALREKSKLRFVDGSCVKGRYKGELAEQWEKGNAIVLSWIGSTVSNELMPSIGTNSVTSYYSKIKDLWDELDVIAPLASCDCEESRPSVELLKNIRLLQFLMGLNESYRNIRSNILAKRPVITVNEAYAMVTEEESQRTMGLIDTLKDPLTMMAGKSHEFRQKRLGLVCDYCGYKRHLKENYYKIVGYHQISKARRKAKTQEEGLM